MVDNRLNVTFTVIKKEKTTSFFSNCFGGRAIHNGIK